MQLLKFPHWMFHRWGKWISYEMHYMSKTLMHGVQVGDAMPQVDLRQRRQCLDCGKVQDSRVGRMVELRPPVEEQLQRQRVEDR